jgi:hypothetical protein
MISIDKKNIRVETDYQPLTDYVYGVNDGITFYSLLPYTDSGFKNAYTSHLWGLLGFQGLQNLNFLKQSPEKGGVLDTAMHHLVEAYETSGAVALVLPDISFRTALHSEFRLTIPISGGTGDLSGLTATTLYTSRIERENVQAKGRSFCSPANGDLWGQQGIYETYKPYTQDIGVGYVQSADNNSGVMHMISPDSNYSGGTTGWTEGWSAKTKYTTTNAPLIHKQNDRVSAICYANEGVILIINPDMVNGITNNLASITISGDPTTNGSLLSPGAVEWVGRDLDTKTQVSISMAVPAKEVFGSSNTSLVDASAEGKTCDKRYVTEFCIMNPEGVTIAKGIAEEPIGYGPEDFVAINPTINLTGPYKEHPAVTNGYTTYT